MTMGRMPMATRTEVVAMTSEVTTVEVVIRLSVGQ